MLNVHTDLIDELDAQEYYLASHIARHLNRAGRCWPSITRLMTLTGWSKNTVLKVRRRLVKKGVYCTERHQDETGRNASTNYQITTGQIRLYAGEESRLEVMVQNLNHQQILIVHPVNPDGSRNEPEVLSREVLFPSVPGEQKTDDEIQLVEVFDPEVPDLEAPGGDRKEKSSAQKEKSTGQAAITLNERMAQAREQLRRSEQEREERGAAIRTFQPAHQELTDEYRRHRRDELLAWLTEQEAGRAEWQQLRTALAATEGELTSPYGAVTWLLFQANLTAEVIASNRKLMLRLARPAGVELTAERETAAKRATVRGKGTRRSITSGRRRDDGRVKDCPSTTDWSDLTNLLPPSSARPAQTA